MEKTIRVTGTAKKTVKPDMQCVTFSCSELCKTYEDSLKLFETKNNEVNSILTKLGFDKKDWSMSSFNIEQDYDYYKEKIWNKEYSKKQVNGFKLYVGYKVDFLIDTKRLGELLYGIKGFFDKHNNIDTDIVFNYYIKDEMAIKNQVLEMAVKDCEVKSKILADAANVSIKEIQDINYSWDTFKILNRNEHRLSLYECRSAGGFGGLRGAGFGETTEIAVGDIDVNGEVSIVYSIK